MSMKKIQKILFVVLVLLMCGCFFTACQKPVSPSTDIPKDDPPKEEQTDDYTLLIYMCGSDLESKYGSASKNLAEIMSADIPENVNVLVQTGGAKKWQTSCISSQSTDRYLIKDGGLEMVDRNSVKQNFGEEKTLTEFIQYGYENYPAKKTALILWNHGNGSTGGVCFDENFSYDGLTITELYSALKNAKCDENKLDFIGFDACLMANFETAYLMREFSDNMIASEEKEPNSGWSYKPLLESLGKEEFYQTVLSSYAEKSQKHEYYTLSHIRLNKLDTVIDAFDELIKKWNTDTQRNVVSSVSSAMSFGTKSSNHFDLGQILSYYNIECNLAEIVDSVSGDYRKESTGINMFFPLLSSEKSDDFTEINPYKPYAEYLSLFYKEKQNTVIEFLNYAFLQDDKLAFSLAAKSMDYIGRIDYFLIKIEQNEEAEDVIVLGSDTDINISETTVTICFSGRWVQIDGQWLYCEIIEDNNSYTVYQSPVCVNSEWANIYFAYDKINRTPEILGVIYDESDRLQSLNQGDEITIIERHIVDYTIKDIENPENVIVYQPDKTQIDISVLEDGYYQYTAFVTDVYGKKYTAGTAVVSVKDGILKIEAVTTDEANYFD